MTRLELLPARLLRSSRLAALTDQGLISGTNFLAFLYCARVLSPEHWGSVGFAYAAVLFCQGFQRAMVTIPMISFSPTPAEWERSAAAWAALNTRLGAAMALGAVAVAMLAQALDAGWLGLSAAMGAAMMLPMFWMEFARRAAIQEGRFGRLIGMAAAYSAGVILVIALWPRSTAYHWAPPLAAAGGALAATLVFCRGKLRALVGSPRHSLASREYRHFGLWASLSHLGFSGYNFGIQGLLGAMAGPGALGIFHACRTLLQPVNTLIGAMDSIDKPQAARAYAQAGRSGLFATLGRAMLAITGLAGAYIGLMLAFDQQLLDLAYGPKYRDQGSVVALWALVAALMALAQPIESGLYVIRRTREMFFSRLLASTLSLFCAAWLIGRHGVLGALVAMSVGYGVTAVLGGSLLRRNA